MRRACRSLSANCRRERVGVPGLNENQSVGPLATACVIATGLAAAVDHTLRIEPVFDPEKERELRLESICVAGGDASVRAAQPR